MCCFRFGCACAPATQPTSYGRLTYYPTRALITCGTKNGGIPGALFVTIAVKQWVFTLSAISVIGEAGSGGKANVGVYLFYVLATQTLAMTPILVYAAAPHQSAKPLKAAQAWLERHNRRIVIVTSLIFGAWFLFKGITGLIG
ncbi:GAP family protein [Lacipirellula limnantheis]|uniref:GAP family protein n=1 Tax=Lacipirellula limnantheis TaxID=2528024 RepID=UPI00143D3A1D|nr:GAP family protein [Lacipirellula limnantheis]